MNEHKPPVVRRCNQSISHLSLLVHWAGAGESYAIGNVVDVHCLPEPTVGDVAAATQPVAAGEAAEALAHARLVVAETAVGALDQGALSDEGELGVLYQRVLTFRAHGYVVRLDGAL